MKAEPYMLEPASNETKLERMAGQVAAGLFGNSTLSTKEVDPLANDVLNIAIAVLAACHEAQEKSKGSVS